MKHYSGTDLPFSTSNAALAFSLYIAGIPFADDSQPLQNIYDAEILRNLGYSGAVETAMQEAFAAGERGHVEYSFARSGDIAAAIKAFDVEQKAVVLDGSSARAIVAEVVQKHAGGLLALSAALSCASCVVLKRWRTELREWEQQRAYSTQKNRNEVRNYDARELAEKVFLSGHFYAFTAVIMDSRRCFLDLWRKYPPLIRLHRKRGVLESRATDAGKVQTFAGFVIYSENAENDTRRTLGVPTK